MRTTTSEPFLIRRSITLFLVPCIALLAAGCGGSDSKSAKSIDVGAARAEFQKTCKSCHTLADAEANGMFGPDLDMLQPSREQVLQQIKNGGGGMPAGLLTGDDAELVADYVAQVAGAQASSKAAGDE